MDHKSALLDRTGGIKLDVGPVDNKATTEA